jgi:hypothetical protein
VVTAEALSQTRFDISNLLRQILGQQRREKLPHQRIPGIRRVQPIIEQRQVD